MLSPHPPNPASEENSLLYMEHSEDVRPICSSPVWMLSPSWTILHMFKFPSLWKEWNTEAFGWKEIALNVHLHACWSECARVKPYMAKKWMFLNCIQAIFCSWPPIRHQHNGTLIGPYRGCCNTNENYFCSWITDKVSSYCLRSEIAKRQPDLCLPLNYFVETLLITNLFLYSKKSKRHPNSITV